MRIEKLFKVLVVGGSVLTAGCGSDAPTAGGAAVTATADVPVARVASDAGAADAPPADVGAVDAGHGGVAADSGVHAWLSWV